jgi:hypothetical protein
MSCKTHEQHEHKHGGNCGHTAVQHEGHTDYLHDSHLHHVHEDHVDEHALSESTGNAASCTPEHKCEGHEAGHQHGENCGHEAIPHASHTDYLVSGHLHQPCGTHCDDHGKVATP